MLENFPGVGSKSLHSLLVLFKPEKQNSCLVFMSSTKREIWDFHVVVVQRRQRNVQKSVMHVQSCCFPI